MAQKKPVAVVIPVYKKRLSASEKTSLNQCIQVLSKHPIIFVAPENLELSSDYDLVSSENRGLVRFKPSYFESISGYNKLMLSVDFYKAFSDYKFILIYQLDALVFKDELLYWCKQNYDFIGAPHPPSQGKPDDMQFLRKYSIFLAKAKKWFGITHNISHVGNGGLSLRKISSFCFLLTILKSKANNWQLNEDSFFEYWGNLFFPLFKLPTDEIALKFSVESSPLEALGKMNNMLPFGCHAFEKYDFSVWKPFVADAIQTQQPGSATIE